MKVASKTIYMLHDPRHESVLKIMGVKSLSIPESVAAALVSRWKMAELKKRMVAR